jgi:inosine-uridine nucleoside N-ribohydrolase
VTHKILLDTDIGSDIDDALCLSYLLRQPQCELMGITTVTGDVVARAKLASLLCLHAGKPRVPIFPGARLPLLVPETQPHVPQASALKKWPHRKDFPSGQAVEFLRSTIRKHPGEILLLTIGPLTNIALLFAADPRIPSLLKGLVMMAGLFEYRLENWWDKSLSEWNIRCDPHAADIVYRARLKVHQSVGLDVTMRCQLSAAQVHQRFKAPGFKPVLDMAKEWFKHAGTMTFHDPLAGASIFEPGLLRWTRGLIETDLGSAKAPGMLVFKKDPGGPHQYASGIKPKRFFKHYFKILSR